MKAKRRKADEYRREAKKSKSEEEKKGLVAKAEACIKAASDIKVWIFLEDAALFPIGNVTYVYVVHLILFPAGSRNARGEGPGVAALQQLRRARRGGGEGDLVVGPHVAEVRHSRFLVIHMSRDI